MNPHQYNQMYKQLVRPSREKTMAAAKKEMGIPEKEKVDGHEILNWVNYNTKVYGTNELPLTPEERKTGERIEKAIANGGPTANADQVRGLKNRLNKARQYTTPPKKVSTKPRYIWNAAKGELEDTQPNKWKFTSRYDEINKSPEELVGEIYDVTKPKKKKQIKKVADSSLSKPQGPLPYNFDKWLDTIDPQWWLPEDYEAVKDPVEEARLRHLKLKQMEEARLDSEGIRTLLKPKRLT